MDTFKISFTARERGMIFWGSFKNGCAWLLRPYRRSGKPVSLGQAWRKPRKHTKELVGTYSDADRRLWLAVSVGFTSLVEIALAKGGDASKTFQMKNDLGATVTVDLLLLCWMRMAGNRATLRSSLADAGLSVCDPIARWDLSPDDELETYDQDGSVICEETMDGNAVARLLIPAGADPHRAFNDIRDSFDASVDAGQVLLQSLGAGGDRSLRFESNPSWVAAEHVEEWRALARHVHLDEALPSAQLAESRVKVRF